MKNLFIYLFTIILVSACCDSSTPQAPYVFRIIKNGKSLVVNDKEKAKILQFDDNNKVSFQTQAISQQDTLLSYAFNPNSTKFLITNNLLNRTDTLIFPKGFSGCYLVQEGATLNGKAGKAGAAGVIIFEIK